ncbi:hypothetical protein GLA29479_814 [Lysobacter antibioticus]|nr:hypothetical protein GLA29479_814 [Lysobacter antibioticus]
MLAYEIQHGGRYGQVIGFLRTDADTGTGPGSSQRSPDLSAGRVTGARLPSNLIPRHRRGTNAVAWRPAPEWPLLRHGRHRMVRSSLAGRARPERPIER